VLLDVFLTVLYARLGTGILSVHLARAVWFAFRVAAPDAPPQRGTVLSFCGPVMLVLLLLTWAIGLTLGTALVMHPYLGSAITASGGSTHRDFVTALFVGGSSLSIVGGGDYAPQTSAFKIFYLFNSLVGLSVISLTLTYLSQIYNALQSRNSTALQLDISTASTGDAAEFIAHLGPRGHFESGYTDLSSLAQAIARVKEAHHFYPVLFYFRFEKPIYAVSRITNVALDTVSLIRSALDPSEYRWLIESGAVTETWDASLLLLNTLESTFLDNAADRATPDADTRDRWAQRFFRATRRLQEAGIALVPDLHEAANTYIDLRSQWSSHVKNLAPAMRYSEQEIDPPLA
jgi:hypothetical protein